MLTERLSEVHVPKTKAKVKAEKMHTCPAYVYGNVNASEAGRARLVQAGMML